MPHEPTASRRSFIQTTTAAIAGAAIASAARPLISRAQDAPEPKKKLGFAFVGIGGLTIGQLLPEIKTCKYCKPVALVSGHPDKAKQQAEQNGIDPKNIYTYENYDAIKDNPEIDVVYNVLPNGMHCEYTVRAFQAGKHVLCEKPMANTVNECQQMIDAGRKAGKQLMVAYRLHYEPNTLAAIELLRKKTMGPVQIIEAGAGFRMGGPGVWRLNKKLAGGGCMMDIGIYALQAARYLSGEEPMEVSAQTFGDRNDPRFKEVEQHCNFLLKFPSGATAACTSSYNTGLNRFTAHCERGQLSLEPGLNYHGIKLNVQGRGAQGPGELPDINQFAAEMDAFAEVINNGAPNRASGEEGLQDMRIIEAIYKSAETGNTVKL